MHAVQQSYRYAKETYTSLHSTAVVSNSDVCMSQVSKHLIALFRHVRYLKLSRLHTIQASPTYKKVYGTAANKVTSMTSKVCAFRAL